MLIFHISTGRCEIVGVLLMKLYDLNYYIDFFIFETAFAFSLIGHQTPLAHLITYHIRIRICIYERIFHKRCTEFCLKSPNWTRTYKSQIKCLFIHHACIHIQSVMELSIQHHCDMHTLIGQCFYRDSFWLASPLWPASCWEFIGYLCIILACWI